MKKQYRKPEIAIEDFVLNQFIAGSANYDEWGKELDQFTLAAIEAGQFIEKLSCTVNADDDNDTICYHTQGSPLFQS